MRLLRFLILVGLVAIAGRLVVRSVRFESNADQVRITIDKNQLQQSGRDAAGKLGAVLERAGRSLDPDEDAQPREPSSR